MAQSKLLEPYLLLGNHYYSSFILTYSTHFPLAYPVKFTFATDRELQFFNFVKLYVTDSQMFFLSHYLYYIFFYFIR